MLFGHFRSWKTHQGIGFTLNYIKFTKGNILNFKLTSCSKVAQFASFWYNMNELFIHRSFWIYQNSYSFLMILYNFEGLFWSILKSFYRSIIAQIMQVDIQFLHSSNQLGDSYHASKNPRQYIEGIMKK